MYEPINLRHFLFNIVMASQITTSKDNRTGSDTDLSIVNTENAPISVFGPMWRGGNYNT